ncbi:MAG TPA: di-heme oxidoredictase family protein [Verrucomicrobiae bacterium]|nr:di-heme oxidoredictase family protein [Verrucomicrobiae bacterium]
MTTHWYTPLSRAGKFTIVLAAVLLAGTAFAQTDPGPRGGTAGAGNSITGLTTTQQTNFAAALDVFSEVDSVKGTIAGEDGVGLGPTFNGNSCAQCHAEPAVGGSSPGLNSRLHSVPNPQVALATRDGALNSVPSFITSNGPVREARFISTNPDDVRAPLDGGVHGLYTIRGRTDATGCNLLQPDFATQLSKNNVIFRIPTPLFGLGLVEATPDANFASNLAANAAAKSAAGVTGRLNTTGNDGTVTKFGWKAQNKSLMVFAGEAYNVEQGVSNENFTNERGAVAGCVFNTNPEDKSDFSTTPGNMGASDLVQFALFMRLLAAPAPAPATTSINNGSALFDSVGCSFCHSRNLTSGPSPVPGLNRVTYHPFSDFALHHMGSQLNDGVHQGDSEPDEFRTAPLWGVGQRLFFMHDGRTTDLLQAIAAHAGGTDCFTNQDFDQFSVNGHFFQPFEQSNICQSEATTVVSNFNALTTAQKQDLLNFLRSL